MVSIYILKSRKSGRFYIGSSTNVSERLKRHNLGQVPATSKFRPYEVVFSQEYGSMTEARKIEARLKRLKRRDYIEKIVRNQKITVF